MWKDIPGQDRVKELLRSYCESGNIPHAFLFTGNAGAGKTRMAREFFKAVNCLERPSDACGRCASCVKVMANAHPDLVEMNPLTRWIRVDEVRDILADVGLRPFEARTKFVIVEPAESLNTEGANALLKTLEEPPGQTVIVLVSHRPRLLLPTIVSRCQLIRFSAPDEDTERETEGADQPDSRGMGEADGVRKEILSLLRGSDPAVLAKKLFDQEGWDQLPGVLLCSESVLRDLMVIRHGSDRLVNDELREVALRHVGMDEIEEIASLISSMRRGVNENINLRIAATELFIRISQLSGK